ncbi:hypothetical protein JW979_07105, partial [bacterium]|nr:hypothetical protein [candidate division CSSED10-310 bacterium]
IFLSLVIIAVGIRNRFFRNLSIIFGAYLTNNERNTRTLTLISIGIISILIGIFYCTGSGLYWLDVTDHFMNYYGLVIVALFEAIFIGWIIKPKALRDFINDNSEFKIGKWWDVLVKYIIPFVLIILILSWLKDMTLKSYEGYPRWAEFAGGWIFVLIIPVIALLLSGNKRAATIASILVLCMLAFSLYAGISGLEFAGIMVFNLAFLILFGGVGICLLISLNKMKKTHQITDPH